MKITNYYKVKLNICMAIITVLPSNDNDSNNFCFQRYTALKKCSLCLPKELSEFKNMDNIKDRIDLLYKYIINFNKESCYKSDGIFRVLNVEEKNALNENNYKANLLFKKFKNKLLENYKFNITKLKVILEELSKDTIINIESLNEIGLRTKNILDALYSSCELNYILGVIAFLKADLSIIKKESENNLNLFDSMNKLK
jgi:hypothetical protein